MAAQLREADDPLSVEHLRFVVSRCISSYRVEPGPLTFMKRRFQAPVVAVSELTPLKRRLFTQPKLLVSGVSRRLAAARDHRGLALGVGVYAVLPHAIASEIALALLNSPSVTHWYRQQFPGAELSGGYLGVNCPHLCAIPVPIQWIQGDGTTDQVIALVRQREQLSSADPDLDSAIERLVREALFDV